MPSIRQITIIGTGLIGGSLALALKKHKFAGKIIGCDSPGVMDRARNRGTIDEAIGLPADRGAWKRRGGSGIACRRNH